MSTVTEVVSYVKACAQSKALGEILGEIARGHLAGHKVYGAFVRDPGPGTYDRVLATAQVALDSYVLYSNVRGLGLLSQYVPYVVAGGYLLVGIAGGMSGVRLINALGTPAFVLGRCRSHPKQAMALLATVVYRLIQQWYKGDETGTKRKKTTARENKGEEEVTTPTTLQNLYEYVSNALRVYAVYDVLRQDPRVCALYQSLRPHLESITAAQVSTVVDALRG